MSDNSTSNFIGGKRLCRDFFIEHGKPVLDKFFPGLCYSAGLLGYGSDVLGYDDVVSTDHMWGPRFYLFLSPSDIALKESIMDVLSRHLPYTYKGYSVHFSLPDPNDNGIRHAEEISSGRVSPLIFIHTIDEFLTDYLGTSETSSISPQEWLAFSEHRLLTLTSGDIYHDDLELSEKLCPLYFYPNDVKLYLIASQWALISEEQAFVKRCGSRGDDLGSRLACARITERLMRLCFLYCDKYAPYSKWFGSSFERLDIDGKIKTALKEAVAADSLSEREDQLVEAQHLVACLHNERGITEPVNAGIQQYFGRDIKVIYTDRIADAVSRKLVGTFFERLPLVGSMSQIGNFPALSDNPNQKKRVLSLYSDV